jgi:hypothetical protein
VLVNCNGVSNRSADVLMDFSLNGAGSTMTVLGNTAERASLAAGAAYQGTHPTGSAVAVNRATGGPAFVSITNLGPSVVIVLGRP